MYEGLVNNLRKAADEWENKHPFIAFGELRVHDALRDAARALKEADDTLERVTLERDAAVAYLAMTKDCKTCKHFPHAASEEPCRSCGVRQGHWEWRGVKEEKQ